MISDNKPYSAMRDSGVPWLGAVPAHWEVLPNRALFAEVTARDNIDEQMLSVTIKRGVIEQQQLLTDSSKKDSSRQDKSAYKLVCPGDVAYNKMRAWQGAVGVSELRGIVSPAYIVMRPVGSVVPRYFHYLLRTRVFAKEAERWSYGITSDMWSLRPEHFKLIYCCLPSNKEQAAIVRFLDHADRRIRKAIRAKQKLIVLLGGQKQAIIHRAVTRGLDPDVRLKHSGVEWFGAVPEHWEMMPLKRAFLSMDYGISESSSDTGAIPMLTMGHLKDGRVTVPPSGGVNSVDSSLLLKAGDLLFNRTNSPALVGKVGLFTGYDSPVTFASYLVRMRPHLHHEPEYLNTVLNDALFLSAARSEAIPSLHQSNLNPTRYGRLHLVLPPQSEQRQIFQALEQETADIVGGINVAQNEISLLREYRTRLIADVVTGKLDVREAAARLPDEGEAAEEALDDAVLAESDEDIDASAAEVDPEDVAA